MTSFDTLIDTLGSEIRVYEACSSYGAYFESGEDSLSFVGVLEELSDGSELTVVRHQLWSAPDNFDDKSFSPPGLPLPEDVLYFF
jgi:hypothetical protein